jgi:hypothetical protein
MYTHIRTPIVTVMFLQSFSCCWGCGCMYINRHAQVYAHVYTHGARLFAHCIARRCIQFYVLTRMRICIYTRIGLAICSLRIPPSPRDSLSPATNKINVRVANYSPLSGIGQLNASHIGQFVSGMHMHIHVHIHMRIHIHIFVHIHTYMYTYTCAYICIYT